MGSDSLKKLEFKIPSSAVLTLAIEAHKRNMTLNDYIVGLAVKDANDIIAEENASAKIIDLEVRHGNG